MRRLHQPFEIIRDLWRHQGISCHFGLLHNRQALIKIYRSCEIFRRTQSDAYSPLLPVWNITSTLPRGAIYQASFVDSEPLNADPTATPELLAQLLSIELYLSKKGKEFHWKPEWFVSFPDQNLLTHFVVTGNESSNVRWKHLLKFVAPSPDLYSLLKRASRRKTGTLAAALREVMSHYPIELRHLLVDQRSLHPFIRKVLAGFYEIAAGGRQSIVGLVAPEGAGKSTQLYEIQKYLARMESIVFTAPPVTNASSPLFHLKRFCNAYLDQALLSSDDAKRIHAELNGADPAAALRRMFAASLGQSRIVVIDDFDRFDEASQAAFRKFFEQESGSRALFILSGSRSLVANSYDLPERKAEEVVSQIHLPLWESEQRKKMLERLFHQAGRSFGTFKELLTATFSQPSNSVLWPDRHWMLPDAMDAVALPPRIESKVQELSREDLEVLRMCAVHGVDFFPELLPLDASNALTNARSSGLVTVHNGAWRFRAPVIQSYFLHQLDPLARIEWHRKLASHFEGSDFFVSLAHSIESMDLAHAAQKLLSCVVTRENREKFFEACRELHLKSPAPDSEILREFYLNYVRRLMIAGNFCEAAEIIRAVLHFEISDPMFVARCRLIFADASLATGRIHLAEEALNACRNIPSMGDDLLLLNYYLARSTCSFHRGSSDQTYLEKALHLAGELQDYGSLCKGFLQQAEAALNQGTLLKAKVYALRSLKYSARAGLISERAISMKILGTIAWRQGRFGAALKFLSKALKAYRRMDDLDGMANVYSTAGNILFERLRLRQATAAFRKAAKSFAKRGQPKEVTLAMFNLAQIYIELGQIARAEKIFLKCREFDQKGGNKKYYAADLRALGAIAIVRGHHRKADRLFRRAEQIWEDLSCEGEILQTRILSFFNKIDSDNFPADDPIVKWMTAAAAQCEDITAQAEMYHLLALYSIQSRQNEHARAYLKLSVEFAKKAANVRLYGKNQILDLMLRETVSESEVMPALQLLRKTPSVLDDADYQLLLFRSSPELLNNRRFRNRALDLKRFYKKIGNRKKHQFCKTLLRKKTSASQEYAWWSRLLSSMAGGETLDDALTKVLHSLSTRFKASVACFQYLNPHGIFERIYYPEETCTDLMSKTFSSVRAKNTVEAVLDVSLDPGYKSHEDVQSHGVNSLMAVPWHINGSVAGMWYLQKNRNDQPFQEADVDQMMFFAASASPLLERRLKDHAASQFARAHTGSQGSTDFVGASSRMLELYRTIDKLAGVEISVLIRGESGTGKELVARTLHRKSSRSAGAFLALNCSALPDTLIESELFGYARGAFTGAAASKPGLIERAHNGTLFLDEIGDLSLSAQAKLLRVMQEREIQRLGETSTRKVDVRFLFATHKDLARLVSDGTYREDLFYRISVYTLNVPALRERKEDIPELINHFLRKYSSSFGREGVIFSSAAMQCFVEYSWPGNVRQLENFIQTLLVNAEAESIIDVDMLPETMRKENKLKNLGSLSLEEAKQEFEKEFLKDALQRHNGNKSQTAKHLKISRQGLLSMLQRLGIQDV